MSAPTAFNPEALVARAPDVIRHHYEERDTILYALGAGAAIGFDGRPELQYLYERNLQALPTMAVVLAYPGFWQMRPEFGIDWTKVLHGEQSVTFHRPLPTAGEVIGYQRIKSIYDKGAAKGSLLYAERRIVDAANGELLATVVQGSFLRGDGGRGSVATEPAPVPHPLPQDRPADVEVTLSTRPEQAIVYRLSGDYNPLHIDPDVAASAGFAGPILHGLCTYALAGRALTTFGAKGAATLKRLDVRFSSPVFPGETIRFEIWREAQGRAAFRATVTGRDVVVLNNGYAELA